MNLIASKANELQDPSRIDDEIVFLSNDLDLKTFILVNASGKVLFANHTIWRGNNAGETVEEFSPILHDDVVKAGIPTTKVDFEAAVLSIYYPLTLEHADIGKQPQLVFMEYDLYPKFSAAEQSFRAHFFFVWGLITLFLLAIFLFIYWSFQRPIRQLINAIDDMGVLSSSFLVADELVELQQLLYKNQQRYRDLINKLKDNEQRWLFAIDSTRNGIWDWHISSRKVFLSDRWKEMLGFMPEELEDSFLSWKERLHPEDQNAVLLTLQAFLDGKVTEFESLHRLRHKDGHYVWILDRGMIIEWDENGQPSRMIGTHKDVSEDVNNQQTLTHLYSHDSLTNLINRHSLMKQLQDLFASNTDTTSYSAMFCLDLDNFKVINDALGHQAGDQLLVQLAARLSAQFSDNLVSRLTGDEFVIVREQLGASLATARDHALVVAGELRRILGEGFSVDGRQLHLSGSLGIYVIDSREQLSPDELLRRTELAMFTAKEISRDSYIVYTPDLEQRASKNLLLQSELRNALKQDQLAIHYQPVVTGDGKLVAAEALLRWYHPEHGYISPAEFIPYAERNGFINTLSEWVITDVCRFINDAIKHGYAVPRISINISAKQFNQVDFVSSFLETISQLKVSATQLQLELTEHLLLTELSIIQSKFEELRRAGVAIAIDDFGTGYSSLSYLQHLPLAQLKIDQSFVQQIGCGAKDDAIITTIVSMAHALELEVVAEGVETLNQRNFLINTGCDRFQGYLWSKPVAEAEFVELLSAGAVIPATAIALKKTEQIL
ncbi:EAL domain-containing protein [Shewanella yunxiaonensis]|uniref:EAL domain-containing protein n=1 Tax=Shewanella yunxiaonensis TaxID=2829809 RepID=A0ABX7YSV4_9GAMM|nr:GGDEF domain-containing phosphodiesterase [Shewanella yunxiaonensis]QUN05883.1 EAL domain-containing protein [Shewanella yunxiaonensis]